MKESSAPGVRRKRILLCILSGALLGASFPPSPAGILACFGLIPLLIVLADFDRPKGSFRYIYLAMFVFHLITLNWTGGFAHAKDPYMMIAGSVTMILHPFFYFLPLGLYMMVRKSFGDRYALMALPFLWVGYEYSHSLSEWSFPWLTLGNSQTYNLTGIQFTSITGVFGLSFWIVLLNCLGFVLYTMRGTGSGKPSTLAVGAAMIVLYFLPQLQGWYVLSSAPPMNARAKGKTIAIGMVQSNVDPWEKWERDPNEILGRYYASTDSLMARSPGLKPDLVLWPETAIPMDLLYRANAPLLSDLHAHVDRWGASVLSGMEHAEFYADTATAPPSARRSATGKRFDWYNAASFFQPGVEDVRWYGKMKMVPIAERVPYADAFYFLDFLRWGVGIGGWQIGPDSVIFLDRRTGVRFCSMICYESTYPGFVAGFVKKGAEFISIITIDSWWDHMSGAYQHKQFSILRAIENRRWVARCAVGGISCFIDPYGRTYDATELFTKATLVRRIGVSNDRTYYTEHGDLLGQSSLFLAALALAACIGKSFVERKR